MRRGEIRWYTFAAPDKRRPVLLLARRGRVPGDARRAGVTARAGGRVPASRVEGMYVLREPVQTGLGDLVPRSYGRRALEILRVARRAAGAHARDPAPGGRAQPHHQSVLLGHDLRDDLGVLPAVHEFTDSATGGLGSEARAGPRPDRARRRLLPLRR